MNVWALTETSVMSASALSCLCVPGSVCHGKCVYLTEVLNCFLSFFGSAYNLGVLL